jgi:hypothetical protein
LTPCAFFLYDHGEGSVVLTVGPGPLAVRCQWLDVSMKVALPYQPLGLSISEKAIAVHQLEAVELS